MPDGDSTTVLFLVLKKKKKVIMSEVALDLELGSENVVTIETDVRKNWTFFKKIKKLAWGKNLRMTVSTDIIITFFLITISINAILIEYVYLLLFTNDN